MAKARGLPVKAFGIFILAALVGVLGGLLGVGFQTTIATLQGWAIGPDPSLVAAASKLADWQRVVIPMAGGLCAALLLLLAANRRGPFGITDIIEMVATRKGTINPWHSLMQVASSACSISTGSSIGKEGANSQLAATVGAVLGRVSKSTRTRSVLLGCGVAAGMACSYNAPVAGAVFVMEAVLGNFAMDVFAPIVVAGVTATLVNREFLGNRPLYGANVVLDHPGLVLAAIGLGALCGAGAIVFRGGLEAGRKAFARLRLPLLVSLPLGGAMVGVIGIWLPQVWGNGYDALMIIAHPAVAPTMLTLGAITVMKLVATSISTGSGGLGGVFTPNLVVGGALGAFYAAAVQALWPQAGDQRVAFALVGMAGMCSATMHAPITAVLLVLEMTKDLDLILPLMLCSILGSITARLIDADSIYSARLRERGHADFHGIEELTMARTFVYELMRSDVVKVVDTQTFDDIMEVFGTTRRDSILVVDKNDRLLGHIDIHDVKLYMNDPSLSSVVIAADLTRPIPHVTRDESLASVLPRFDDPELDEVAVVDPAASRLIGRLTRRDVIACLSDEVLGRRQLRAKVRPRDREEATYVELPEGCQIARVRVPDEWVGRALDSIDLAEVGITPLSVIHLSEDGTEARLLAEPRTVLTEGSSLLVIGRADAIDALSQRNGRGPAPPA
jgi:CIC family chloride channel protein